VIARLQTEVGASVLLGVPREADVVAVRDQLATTGLDARIRVARFDRSAPWTMEAALEGGPAGGGAVHGAIFLPAFGPERFVGPLSEAEDADIDAFVDIELGGALALARTMSRYWSARTDLPRNPRFIMMTNASDGRWNSYADLLRAAQVNGQPQSVAVRNGSPGDGPGWDLRVVPNRVPVLRLPTLPMASSGVLGSPLAKVMRYSSPSRLMKTAIGVKNCFCFLL
jgi:hypothetical protein